MTYSFDEYNYVIKLTRGEQLAAAIAEFCKETKLEGAWLSGLGGAEQVTLGYYDLSKQAYEWRTFDGLREVVSLSGNLAADEKGQMMFHLHGVFSDRDFQTIGGHVKDLTVGATLELFAHRTWKPLARVTDPDVGLQLLSLDNMSEVGA